jgi:serine/threonine protein kinase
MTVRNAPSEELGATVEPSVEPGQRIGAHYEVEGELGRGGMACVYRVRDVRSGKILALKRLLSRRSVRPAFS